LRKLAQPCYNCQAPETITVRIARAVLRSAALEQVRQFTR
jgi:hypothetical protein